MISWHYPITPVPQLPSWSCLWDVLLVVTTDMLPKKETFLGADGDEGNLSVGKLHPEEKWV